MSLTEKEYNELYKYSLNKAHKFIGYKDTAFDIAQNAILAYLSSNNPIEKPKPWLSTVVKREALKFLASEKKEIDLIKTTAIEDKVKQTKVEEEESVDFSSLSVQKIKKIIGPQDFKIYQTLKKYDMSAKITSEKEKIPLETVKAHLRRIKRNISSALLVEDGWKYGQKILNFQQYANISRCINKIITSVKKKQLSSLRTYFRKIDNQYLEQVFSGIDYCHEWSIRHENDCYKLLVICAPLKPIPKFINLSLKFNNKNTLYIIDAVEKKPYLVAEGSIDKINIFKEKGKITLTDEQLVSILSNKQTKL